MSDMGEMKQTGVVTAVSGKKATVRFTRSDACGHCNACFRLGGNEADIEIENSLGAKTGDIVAIELHGKSVFKASAIVYGIPVIALVAGAAIGSIWGELYTALAAVLFAAGSFFILRALEPKFSRMNEFKPRMTDIITQEDSKGETDNAQTPDKE